MVKGFLVCCAAQVVDAFLQQLTLTSVLGNNHWYMINSSDIMISQSLEAKQLIYPSKQLQQQLITISLTKVTLG